MKQTNFALSSVGRAKLAAQIVVLTALPLLMVYAGYIAEVPPERTTYARAGLHIAIVAFIVVLRDCIRIFKHRGAGLIIDEQKLDVVFPRSFKARLQEIEDLTMTNNRIEVSTKQARHTIRVKNYASAAEVYRVLHAARATARAG